MSPVRAIVWLAVVAVALGVGWYVSHAPSGDPTPPAPTTPGRFVFVAGGADAYWDLCIAGAEATAQELGAELKVLKPTGEGEDGLREQLEWLSSLDVEKYDGLALGPIDPERQAAQIDSITEKLTVVTVDSDAPSSQRLCYIGSSNHEAGMMAAQMVKEVLPEGGKVVVLMASLAKTNAAQRKAGFDESLLGVGEDDQQQDAEQNASYEVVDYLMDLGDYNECKENVKQVCGQHEDLGAVVATFGYHAPAALEALEELGKQVPVIAFDEHDKTLAGIETGMVHASIAQDPHRFGAEAIKMLNEVRRGAFLSLPVGATVNVGVHCQIIKKDNLEEFKKSLKQ